MEAQDETLSGQKLTLLLPCSHQPTHYANLVSVFLVWAAVHLCSEEAMRTEAGHPENVGARRKSSEGNSITLKRDNSRQTRACHLSDFRQNSKRVVKSEVFF